MMDKFIIGRYVPGESIVHRMDPRAKLLMVLFYICIVFLANNWLSYALLIIFTVALILLTRIKPSFIIQGLKPVIILIILTLVIQLFFTKRGEVVFTLFGVDIYDEGIKMGIFISLRFTLLILITSVMTLTTTPIEITDGLETLLNPLKKLKFPVHELALMMSISLRFIPTLLEETDKIVKAQTSRGVDFSSGPLKERLRAVVPLLVPLFVGSFKRADELAVAMEARGYRGGEGRTKYRALAWHMRDSLLIGSLILLTILLIWTRS
jgi:energy-coupling factor transport system permease protein